jgi:protein-L-isoaspartate(D-aspartate) O-methyltransferase
MAKSLRQSEEFRFRAARKRLVDSLEAKGVLYSPRVIQAFMKVPRHQFVDEAFHDRAYEDQSLPIGNGQTISHPSTVARMTELLNIGASHRVLEIGSGCGYQTAILAELAGKVFSIELLPTLARKAKQHLEALGYYSVRLETGDGSLGWPDAAPFDRILITAGTPAIPSDVNNQLSTDGLMVLPVGNHEEQVITLLTQSGQSCQITEFEPCKFVDLIGKNGWPDIS